MPQYNKTLIRGQKTLSEFTDQAVAILTQTTGATAEEAMAAAQAITAVIVSIWGGETIRVPHGATGGRSALLWYEMNERNIEIYNNYNGSNLEFICKKYSIGKTRLYQILHEVRSNKLNKKKLGSD